MICRWSRTGMLLLASLVTVAPASADGPGSRFKRTADAPLNSPDGQLRVEQFSKPAGDDVIYQFWTFDRKQRASRLNPGEGADLAGYAAGFRFSPDSQWLVRMQKLGAGYHTLFLYRRHGHRFSAATTRPLGDLAWDYFFAQPVSRDMKRDPGDRTSLHHAQAHLLAGLGDNYAGIGQKWPDSRFLVISLSFDVQGQETPSAWVEGWRCAYDLKTGKFSVPPDFAGHNAAAVKLPGQGRQ